MAAEKPVILYDNRLADGTPTASSTASGYSPLNLSDWRTYTYWKPSGTAPQYVTVDCGSAKSADSLGIIGHDLYTQNAQIAVEASSDNFGADVTTVLAAFSPTSNKAIFKIFASISKRYWRLKIVSFTSQPFLAILAIGSRLTFEKFLSGSYDPQGEQIQASSERNTEGQLLGSVIHYVQRRLRPAWSGVSNSFITQTFLPAWDGHLSQMKPFFWIWNFGDDPDNVVLAAIPSDFELAIPYGSIYRSLTLEFVGVKEA
ncbi:MAG: hypothetical protein HY760_07920 [Nitrospirae bacterium]|nr:hypothetical protein [Nitrospirota bacterium]